MNKEDIYNKIVDMIANQFDIDKSKINGDLNFKNDLDADSIDFVEFVLDLESEFGSEISDDDAEHLNTVNEAVDYISSHLKN